MLTKEFILEIESLLTEKTGLPVEVVNHKTLSGGSINNAAQLITSGGDFFMKWNFSSRFPGMMETEVKGINLLHTTNVVSLPAVIACGIYEDLSFLILQMLIPGKRTLNYYEVLGKELAMLHKNQSGKFGLDHSNYIGSLPQSNRQHDSGADFMITERYEPLVKMAHENQLLEKSHLNLFTSFGRNLSAILPGEPPSLLHGDLWNGNVITGPDGKAWMIDPSAYYGYRETDLAMARLFGGFDESFYTGYREIFPLQKGWEQRIELFQLYPLLVHLNLFGLAYRESVIGCMKKYC